MPSSPLLHDPSSAVPLWHQVARRFPVGRDCLTSFIAFEAAEVLEGIKPANLVNVVNRRNACGMNLYRLWQEYGEEILEGSGLGGRMLRDRGDSLLLLLFDPQDLARLLESRRGRSFLKKAGYPSYYKWHEALDRLQSRVGEGREFPHEIGLFLGYPLKDVAAFIGWAPLPFTCQGPWKMYGDATCSLELARRHRECRGEMVRRLGSIGDPRICLRPSERRVSCASR